MSQATQWMRRRRRERFEFKVERRLGVWISVVGRGRVYWIRRSRKLPPHQISRTLSIADVGRASPRERSYL